LIERKIMGIDNIEELKNNDDERPEHAHETPVLEEELEPRESEAVDFNEPLPEDEEEE
jgi:hypothetical protein